MKEPIAVRDISLVKKTHLMCVGPELRNFHEVLCNFLTLLGQWARGILQTATQHWVQGDFSPCASVAPSPPVWSVGRTEIEM